jgi:hypothetical protein
MIREGECRLGTIAPSHTLQHVALDWAQGGTTLPDRWPMAELLSRKGESSLCTTVYGAD